MSRTRLFLVEDHELMRVALRESLAAEDDLVVVGESATAADALQRISLVGPDVALLDLQLPDGNGIEICREVRSSSPAVRCLIVTQHENEDALVDAVMAGASGYVTKDIAVDELISAIRRVAKGESLLPVDAIQGAVKRVKETARADDRTASLTDAELKVLDLIGQGMSNREIADTLSLAEQTIKNYVSRVLAKLGMKRRTEAALFSARQSEEKRRFSG